MVFFIFATSFMKKRYLLIILFIYISHSVSAQGHEIGVFLGGSNYIGDIGRETYIYPNSYAFGAIYKRNINSRYAVRATYIYASIKGDDAQSNNSFRENRGLSFSNSIHELAAGIEFNFFEYGNGARKSNTPYIFLEAAVNNYSILKKDDDGNLVPKKDDADDIIYDKNGNIVYDTERTFNFTIPFGIGFKGKLTYNIGYAIETSFRYTFSDDIDGYPYQKLDSEGNPPVGENIQINPNNNDWYVFTGITLVYTFDTDSRSWKHIWEENIQP